MTGAQKRRRERGVCIRCEGPLAATSTVHCERHAQINRFESAQKTAKQKALRQERLAERGKAK